VEDGGAAVDDGRGCTDVVNGADVEEGGAWHAAAEVELQ
jgi:hypothetical protein